MFNVFRNIWHIPDLRKRLIFTAAILVVFRIGVHIPTPGIDIVALGEFFREAEGTIFGLADLFAGGAMSGGAVFGLGIMPFITVSIIMQLLTAVIPFLEKLAKEGEAGRRKINQYTRLGTVPVCIFQALMMATFLERGGFVLDPGWGFRLVAIVTLTAGTIFLMWLGEQITERGVGEGISLIIAVGIISAIPMTVIRGHLVIIETGRPFLAVMLPAFVVAGAAGIVLLVQAQRRIPLQHAKRVVGRRVYSSQTSYIPLRLNLAGMIPIIFASMLIMFPATIAQFSDVEIVKIIGESLNPGTIAYWILFPALIIFFCYFYTAIIFNPVELADNMKKHGSFIPGVRPGKTTSDYFYYVMNRITLVGAVFLAFIAIMPMIVSGQLVVPYLVASFAGGAGMIIIVGVTLDTVKRVESQLLMRHYDGFMKKGRVRGRR
ncbi:preprotein translocase subunit SecY [candidate division NPL-UPA2 bacterium Unc8]|uniref:Protein translocase subunit SecY n=1 Tax=candidate division NPL-UPA2 bacterium Unc8 TaxID=1980939 RepID=A0A399FWA4_UNCN2|nr:Protein translocase subunit SecY [Bacillota bacterium]MBT9138170.1 Protein translocase subunit SecY [Bacillota bacterium]MBT9146843.1 Protein translocase subunit SecY [Bacillota bacterium]RII00287.1 MAG: preprotein translocase subunit SecY [candidate division NPL-UPA2 bacterium Unc8]